MKVNYYHWYDKLLSFLLTILGFSGTFALMGCPAEYGPAPEDHRVKVYPDHLYFDYDHETTQSVQILTEGKWYVHKVSPFVSITPVSGYNDATMKVEMAEENEQKVSRQGVIVVQSVDEPQYADSVIIIQKGKNNGDY